MPLKIKFVDCKTHSKVGSTANCAHDNETADYLSKLATETHLQIGSECSFNDLGALCLTSKLLNKTYTELLYRDVDLSIDSITDEETCADQQEEFLTTIKHCPNYAKYIRSLKWTVIALEYYNGRRGTHPSSSDDEPRGMCQILSSLLSVSKVSFSECSIGDYTRSDVPPDLDLLPKVTDLTLKGDFLSNFVYSVISSSKAGQLERIWFDGLLLDGKEDSGDYEITASFLNSLVGHCTRLKSLKIVASEYQLLFPSGERYDTANVYIKLIDSVRETLEEMYFEIEGERPDPESKRILKEVQELLERGSWPCLRKKTVVPPVIKSPKFRIIPRKAYASDAASQGSVNNRNG